MKKKTDPEPADPALPFIQSCVYVNYVAEGHSLDHRLDPERAREGGKLLLF